MIDNAVVDQWFSYSEEKEANDDDACHRYSTMPMVVMAIVVDWVVVTMMMMMMDLFGKG